MTQHRNHPAGRGFTALWDVNYDDYRRAIALQAHFSNHCGEGIEALLINAAEHGRVRPLFIAMLDLNEALMPALGHPDVVTKLTELAALWAAKHEGNTCND